LIKGVTDEPSVSYIVSELEVETPSADTVPPPDGFTFKLMEL
jgi:hypothetical protein